MRGEEGVKKALDARSAVLGLHPGPVTTVGRGVLDPNDSWSTRLGTIEMLSDLLESDPSG